MNQILPTGLTPENLAAWFEKNHKSVKYKKVRHDFSDEEIDLLAQKAMDKGKEIVRIEEIFKGAKELLTGGTDEERTVIIPPTIGLKKLILARDSFYEKAEKGYEETELKLYGIPDAYEGTMRYFDVEGYEDYEKTEKMSNAQMELYGAPLFSSPTKKAAKDFHEGLASNGMKVTNVTDNTVTIEVSEQKELDFSDPINEEKVDEDGVSEVDFEEEKDILTFDGERVSAEKSEPEKHSSDDDEINDMEFKI